jgi:cbb3-type cytochrome oxidase maturation protein
MSVIIILLIVSICIAGGFLVAFLWSVKDGQFDDIESPANRILFNNNKTNKK